MTFDVVLQNVQNQKNPWVLIPKNTLERKEKVVRDKHIDERRGKWETVKGKRKNRNKVKEKEGETCVKEEVRQEKKGENGGKSIEGCCYQSEICQSVPSQSTQLPRRFHLPRTD